MSTKVFCQLKKRHNDATKTPLEITIATAEITSIGAQDPYFAITADIYERSVSERSMVAGGCQHELVAKLFPEFAPFIRWHLCAINGGPMHYFANALYWAGKSGWCDGKPNSPPNAAYFAKQIVFGAVKTDAKFTIEELMAMESDELADWLNARKPALLKAFYADMKKLFGDNFQLIDRKG